VKELEVEEDVDISSVIDEDNALMNMDIVGRMVDKFGDKILADIGAIVECLKGDLLAQIQKRDSRIVKLEDDNVTNNERITSLEAEVLFLRDSLAATNAKNRSLERASDDLSAAMNLSQTPSVTTPPTIAPHASASASARPTLDHVIAGDSIVKHFDVSTLPGTNKLICLPGARAQKVTHAIIKLARTTDIKNLVVHFGRTISRTIL
jgi:hypothetical protein